MADIFICGDIINRFSDKNFIGPRMASLIMGADYAIGNFEGVVAFEGSESGGMVQRPSTTSTLKDAGFNLLLLSNNHIGDFGIDGFFHTLSEIEKCGFDRTGAGLSYGEAYKPLIKVLKGIRFGFLNVCEALCCLYKSPEQKYGCAWTGAKDLEHIIPSLKKEVDHLIVLPHSGLELQDYPLEHTRELYHHYCDLGADCIVAAHPHVPQGIEQYKGKPIFYSLGNFYFPESEECDPSLETNQSFAVVLTFDGSHIAYKVIYHQTRSLMVEICDKPRKDVEILSSYLNEPAYSQNVGKQNERLFDNKVFSLYKDAVMGIAKSYPFKDRVKLALRLFRPTNKNRVNDALKSFHKLTQSETYINVVDSAIKNKRLG